ncbi:acetate--CoA ligase family protein [Mycolicibacterium goodii]|uniref:acetate--CoA ligase family protein n=1 Tax=Mycolicibacterium goodii TaxID=134601 RepID=UPI001BDC77AE|nr:acetate--CoA ligase family protein [Mycolicibacterium goodii]MBU8819663.1 acetate--CoA ligase family protein [Mycolicibacterium goodii]MBU8833968.1 acetate--CoA ligase family protein [Mycolicibacterium goodii]
MSRRLREDAVRDLAISYGVPANAVTFAATAAEAERVARDLGRPVAIKLVADDVIHKSKAGGVLLGVAPEAVADRTRELLDTQRGNGIHARGVTVEAMVDAGIEAVVGGLRAPGFGPVVMFGHGGVDIETLDDVVFALAPINADDARAMVSSTRLGRVIEKRFPDRLGEVIDALVAVGGPAGMLLNEQITEVDFNPVVITSDRVVAVDARATALEAAADTALRLPDPARAFEALRPAIYPRSVAIIGASADERKMGYRAVRSLVDFGFSGRILPVSAKNAELCGVPTVAAIDDLPEDVDRAVIALPAAAVPDTLHALADRGTRTAHVYTADTPPLAEAITGTSLRVLGPNCIGHYTPYEGMTMISPAASSDDPGHLAVVSQSGTYAGDILRRGTELGLRFSFVSSVGNCDDVSPAELLAFCEADPRTRAAVFYLEDDRWAGQFFRLARTMTKPVVLFKGGRTAAGGAAAASHTGALASDPQLLADAARQAGVLLVDGLDQVMDVLTALQFIGSVDGDNLALVGSGGGVAVVGADRADRWALQIGSLSETTRGRLAKFDAPGSSLSNPIDIPVWSLFDESGSFTGEIVGAVADDPAVDAICAFLDLGTVYDMQAVEPGNKLVWTLTQDILESRRGDTPVALVLRSGLDANQDDVVRQLRPVAASAGVAMFDSVDRAIDALGAVRWLTRHGKTAGIGGS